MVSLVALRLAALPLANSRTAQTQGVLQGSMGATGLFSQSSLQSNFVSDAIIGSLPQGLSGKEREKIYQSVPLSPTLNLLHSMPSVSLNYYLRVGQCTLK